MRITTVEEERDEYLWPETAGTVRNCAEFYQGFEQGWQAMPILTETGTWAVAVYDANLVRVGWTCSV
jgi:hypothetical protein